jgi:hypothetical protein
MRAVVKRVAPGRDEAGEPWCWVGLEWVDAPVELDEMFEGLPRDTRPGPEGLERRQAARFLGRGAAEMEFGVSLPVTVRDVSASGVLFSSSMPLDAGVRGYLRMQVAGEPFQSAFEVRRSGGAEDTKGEWRMGAQFGSMDDRSRRALEGLLNRQAAP